MGRAARWGLFAVLFAAAAAGGAAWVLRGVLADLPDATALRRYRPALTTTVWSRDGVLLAELYQERRKPVQVDTLPSHVIRAFLAAEDSGFFSHEGVDPAGILRAAWTNLRAGRVVQGGSTITQQVAKSLLLSPERSLRRKIREAVLAIRIERDLSKEEILHLYLNQIYLGHGAYGVESASEVYFGISAQELSLAQAALLAGLPQAPSRYDPYRHPERALERRRYVLGRMAEEGWIGRDEAEAAAAEPLELAGYENPFPRVAPYYAEHVRRILQARYGEKALLRGGLRVVVAMDSRLQAAAQKALRQGLEAVDRRAGFRGPLGHRPPADPGPFGRGPAPSAGDRVRCLVKEIGKDGATVLAGGAEIPLPLDGMAWALRRGRSPADLLAPGDVVLCEIEGDPEGGLRAALVQEPEVEGALVCLDPHTGEVLALVGGYEFGRSQFNRAVQARRQPGSALKPLIYAAALAKGYTPATLIYDTPVVYESPDLPEKWKPHNYSERFYGATTLREALVRSRNVVTVKVLQDIGVRYAVGFLKGLGLRAEIAPDLSLALGSPAVSPLDLAAVYTALPAAGVRHDPVFVLRVEDRDGRVLDAFEPAEGERVLSPQLAYVVTDMMKGVVREGTGRAVRALGRPAAGKTGTTNDYRDAWFVGFTPERLAVVWVGYDDNRSLGRRETGGRAAAPVWLAFMKEALAGRPVSDFPVPPGVEFARVDARTGRLAGPDARKTFTAAFVQGTAPSAAAEPAPTEAAAPASMGRALDPKDPAALELLR
ncbi:penicillin-binding protein 1A [Deferrisoma camini]|uniref:penicillin-binding protein 1A n=1 Tax=Deferrisoma camini TaxID=1035120 RepID=UPI00046D4994|nr:PBP1A family penicillin-binding protein [Deferrisoma camini]